MRELWTIVLFQAGYNTTIVLIGATILGIVAGSVGVFSVLNKRALVGDAASHATLPGICLAFLAAYGLNIQAGRSLFFLLAGAMMTSILGLLTIQWIVEKTKLSEDTAIGSVLSVFFGLGLVLLSLIQQLEGGSKAGLESFLLGQIASLTRAEVNLIAASGCLVLLGCWIGFRRFQTVCFDPEYSQSLGWSRKTSELGMMSLTVVVVGLGIKLVGVVLIIALLIIPPVSARFWTDRLQTTLWLSGVFGGGVSFSGAALSAWISDIPTGAAIVLCAGGLFLVSLLLGSKRRL